jgi:hypothetical protein
MTDMLWSVGIGFVTVISGWHAVGASAQETAKVAEPEFAAATTKMPPWGVCPPFHLRDEAGNVINPVAGENTDQPYSPKQTCGQCHDYDKITQGYHFTQGAGETPTADQTARCLWATTPGNYGGTWCSPAPLYKYLAPKKNESPADMDMTSFGFFTSPCAACHPGGGSAEYDRDGKRYDLWMSNPASGLSSGADNGFDGDYYRARWSETGVLEADCLLCHMPEYSFADRNKQLGAWNFRWAATAGARFADLKGSVQGGEPVEVVYHQDLFNADGTIEPHIVLEPRNQACLNCHTQPGWKKRGANFSPRTDVHLRAGMKCVDCHPAGKSATDPRIAGHEAHQIGKGDDPGGQVRNDLDDTCISCADCHDTGRMGAPIAKHRWLPPLHLEEIACQTCHIPERLVMPVEVQASDVFSPGTKIPSKGKYLWTFYGPDWNFRNHYGPLVMMGFDDKPTERFRPKLARYQGKIYPVNRIHSAWPGIEVDGETALMQPKMGDIYKMWTSHQADPSKYPELAKITDDNGDDVVEVNRPEEIEALISSVTQKLAEIDYPLEGKRVVWVMDDRVYTSGTEFRTLEMHPWEASPYANVHKYNHDVLPANAALGATGCTDCHHPESEFFFAGNLRYLFDDQARPVTQPQYQALGLALPVVNMSVWRETYLKPVTYGMLVVLILGLVLVIGDLALRWTFQPHRVPVFLRLLPAAIVLAAGLGAVLLAGERPAIACCPTTAEFMLPSRFALDANHFPVAVAVLVAGVVALLWELRQHVPGNGTTRSRLGSLTGAGLAISLLLACVTGVLIMLKIPGLEGVTRYSYTLFDLAVALVLFETIVSVLRQACRLTFCSSAGDEPPTAVPGDAG